MMLGGFKTRVSGFAGRVADGVSSVPGRVADGVSAVPGRIRGVFSKATERTPAPSAPLADPALCDASVVLAPTPAPAPAPPVPEGPREPTAVEQDVATFMGLLFAEVDLAALPQVARIRCFLGNLYSYYKENRGPKGGHFDDRMYTVSANADVLALFDEVMAHATPDNATGQSIRMLARAARIDRASICPPNIWVGSEFRFSPCVVFSEHMSRSVEESVDGLKVVFNPASGEHEEQFLRGYTSRVRVEGPHGGLRFVGERTLVRCADDGTVAIWDLDSRMGTPVHTLEQCQRVYFVDSHAAGMCLVDCWADGTVRIYNVELGQFYTLRDQYTERVTSVVFSRDGTRVATICSGATSSKVWNAASGEFLFDLPRGSSEVHPLQGSRVLLLREKHFQSDDGHFTTPLYRAYVFDLAGAGASVAMVYTGASRPSLHLSDGHHFVLNHSLYEAATSRRLGTLPELSGGISSCVSLPGGDFLLVPSAEMEVRGHVLIARVWNPESGETREIVSRSYVSYSFSAHSQCVLSPDKTKLAVMSRSRLNDGYGDKIQYALLVRLYDVASGVQISGSRYDMNYDAFRAFGTEIWKIAFSADGNSVFKMGRGQADGGNTLVHVLSPRGSRVIDRMEVMEGEVDDDVKPLRRGTRH